MTDPTPGRDLVFHGQLERVRKEEWRVFGYLADVRELLYANIALRIVGKQQMLKKVGAVREMQIKATVRYYLTAVRQYLTGVINKTNNDKCW